MAKQTTYCTITITQTRPGVFIAKAKDKFNLYVEGPGNLGIRGKGTNFFAAQDDLLAKLNELGYVLDAYSNEAYNF